MEEIAKKAGWELLLNWEQIGIFPYLSGEDLRDYGILVTSRMAHLTPEQQKQLEDGFVKKANEIIL